MAQRSDDLDAAWFLGRLDRIEKGLIQQQARILAHNASLPTLFEGTDHELINHGTDPEIDLDYYAYELGRLRDIATRISERFGWPEEIQQARDRFRVAVPNGWDARNGLTHFNPRRRNDRMINMGAIMELLPDGGVKYLVDARWGHHDAALALAATLRQWLRGKVQTAIAVDPARPIDEQIRNRGVA